MKRGWQLPCMIFLSVLLLGYSGYRAAVMSMTHDASHTVNAFMEMPVWSCLFKPFCWDNANNHLLNSWLIQQSTSLFGISEFSVRLPNLLAHLLYLVVSILIVQKVSKNPWIALMGFCLLNMNPYLIDFFSVGRGYGLFHGFFLLALYGFMRYFLSRRVIWLVVTYVAMSIGVMANFTALNPLVCFIGLQFVLLIYWWQKNEINLQGALKHLLPTFMTIGILSYLLWVPITTLQAKGEFAWGTPSIQNTFRTLLNDSLYAEGYLGGATLNYFWIFFMLATLGAVAMVLWRGIKSEKATKQWSVLVALFLGFVILFMLMQHWLLGSQFLVGRKAAFLIPVIGMTWYVAIEVAPKSKAKIIGVVVVLLFMINHVIRARNYTNTREWWYEKNTKQMMKDLSSIASSKDSVTLGLHWLFMPTANFYKKNTPYEYLAPLEYRKDITTDGRYQYYYVNGEDITLLQDRYKVIKNYDDGRALLELIK